MRKMKKEGIKLFIVELALASFLMLVFCIVAASPDSTLQFIDPTPANYTQEQDFTWGVLAINTHKSIYLPNEAASIGIAVLDNEGRMVCDAAITLTITDPSNNETVLSTGNGLIKVSPQCSVYGVTNLPDFYTNYTVDGAGTYVINLTAVTANGTKSITDEFSVQNSVDFDVARDGATRIYPPVPYVMNFTIEANKNYTGLIREYVPASFVITPQDGLIVTTVGDTKILTWTKNLVKGETYNIYYEFDAPDVSPYLFLLGELQIGDWKEARQWQIASDVVSQTNFPSSATTAAYNPYDDVDWDADTAQYVGADDGVCAEYTGALFDAGLYMFLLNATNYNFNIPSGAKIDGIKLEHERVAKKAGIKDGLVQLIKGGTLDGSDKASADLWPTGNKCTDAVITTYGNTADLWGLNCRPADINAIDFGVAVSATSTIKDGEPFIDFLRITVYYYTPTWESYKEDTHDNVWGQDVAHAYNSDYHIVYMFGPGFKIDHPYKVGYYDGTVEGEGHLVGVGVDVTSVGDELSSSCECMGTSTTEGTWHAVVFDTTGDVPNTYTLAKGDPNYVITDGFEVAESAIPEFPDVIAAIAVCMLCAVAYVVMRRRVGRGDG